MKKLLPITILLLTPLITFAALHFDTIDEFSKLQLQLHQHPPIYAIGDFNTIILSDHSTATIELKNDDKSSLPSGLKVPANSKFIGNKTAYTDLVITKDGKIVTIHLYPIENHRNTFWVPLGGNTYQEVIITMLFNQEPTRYGAIIQGEAKHRHLAFAFNTIEIKTGQTKTFLDDTAVPAPRDEILKGAE